MDHNTSYLNTNYARDKSEESYRIEEAQNTAKEMGADSRRGSCSRLSAQQQTMTDRIIDWLDSEQFKRGCIVFLAFAAGYFLRSIL